MDARHGEPPSKCNRNYRLSLTHVLDAHITSDGLRELEIRICGKEQDKKQ